MGEIPDLSVKPMLSFSVQSPFDSTDHIYEAKWEGSRCLASINRNKVSLYDRCSREITFRYPELGDAGNLLEVDDVLVDGEIIALEEGKPDIARLRYRESMTDPDEILRATETTPVLLIVFDILSCDGKKVMGNSLLERKDLLKSSLRNGKYLVIGSFVQDNGKAFFDQMVKAGFEGMMAKMKQGLYIPEIRSENWLKVTQFKTQDCLVCGYTLGMGKRAEMLGALVLGVLHNETLFHAGQVGSGFTDESLRNIFEALQPYRTDECPFSTEPSIDRQTIWLDPRIICRVEYSDWTADAKLRLPRFLDLRTDKCTQSCTIEDLEQYKRMG